MIEVFQTNGGAIMQQSFRLFPSQQSFVRLSNKIKWAKVNELRIYEMDFRWKLL